MLSIHGPLFAVLALSNASSLPVPIPLESGFIENIGQFDSRVRFVRASPPGPVFVMSDRLVLRLRSPSQFEGSTAIHMVFEGGNASSIESRDPDATLRNFLLGRDPSAWRSGVRSYGSVILEEVWPGIDVVLTCGASGVEYDFILAPGADPGRIRVRFEGANGIEVDDDGVTHLATPYGAIHISKPRSFRVDAEGQRHEVASQHRRIDSTHLGFDLGDLGDRADHERLIIDPSIEFATCLGGSEYDRCVAVKFDAARAIYVGGDTLSFDFPSAAGVQPALKGSTDGFIAKLDANGATAQWVTYFGGTNDDFVSDLDIVEGLHGSLVTFTGSTLSQDLPLSANAPDATLGGLGDSYVARLSADGGQIAYSTYLGGSQDDGLQFGEAVFSTPSIRCLADGTAWIAGYTSSPDFPLTPGAVDTTFDAGAGEGFLTKLNAAGTTFGYSTYFGGSGFDSISDLIVAPNGRCLVIGPTSSLDLSITPGAWQTSPLNLVNESSFVARIDPAGGTIQALSYLVGLQPAFRANSVAEDRSHRVFIGGGYNGSVSGGFENFDTASILELDSNLTKLEEIGVYSSGTVTSLALDPADRLFASANLVMGTQFRSVAMRLDDRLMQAAWTLGLPNSDQSLAMSIAVDRTARFAVAFSGSGTATPGAFDTVAVAGDGAVIVGDLECAGEFTTTAAGCPGSIGITPELHGSGCPIPGSTLTIRISQARGTHAILFLGLGNNVLPLGSNCSLAIGPLAFSSFVLPIFSGNPVLGGSISFTKTIPTFVAPLDIELQAIVLDESEPTLTFAVTNALHLYIAP